MSDEYDGRTRARLARNAVLFGGRPTAYSVAPLQKCAEYWTMKDVLQTQRLQLGRISLNVVPLGFEGIARLKKIFADFNSLRDNWESYQTLVFGKFVNCEIKDILGTDADRCLEMVMAQQHWDEIPSECLVLAYRGSGKTWLLISAIATFFANIPGFTCCCYAGTATKGQDFYSGIVDQVKRLLSRMDPSKRPKLAVTQDLMTATFGDDDVRWIRPFSTFGGSFRRFLSLPLFFSRACSRRNGAFFFFSLVSSCSVFCAFSSSRLPRCGGSAEEESEIVFCHSKTIYSERRAFETSSGTRKRRKRKGWRLRLYPNEAKIMMLSQKSHSVISLRAHVCPRFSKIFAHHVVEPAVDLNQPVYEVGIITLVELDDSLVLFVMLALQVVVKFHHYLVKGQSILVGH